MTVVAALLVVVMTICQPGVRGILENQKLNSLCLPWPPFFLECKDARTTDVCDVNTLPPRCKRKHGAQCETEHDCPNRAMCNHGSFKCDCVPDAPPLYGICVPKGQAGSVWGCGDYALLGVSMMTSLAMQLLLSRAN